MEYGLAGMGLLLVRGLRIGRWGWGFVFRWLGGF